MTLPANILAFATQLRDAFGQGVRLLYVADERTGATQGKPQYDDPGCQP